MSIKYILKTSRWFPEKLTKHHQGETEHTDGHSYFCHSSVNGGMIIYYHKYSYKMK